MQDHCAFSVGFQFFKNKKLEKKKNANGRLTGLEEQRSV